MDHYRGTLSARRLRVLIQALPRESAVVRAIHGEAAEWTVTDHLLAAVVDHLANGNWMFAAAHTPARKRPPERPEPVPRPRPEDITSVRANGSATILDPADGGRSASGRHSSHVDRPRAASTEEIAAFFGRFGGVGR